jgi:hypothetical protein
MMDDCQNDLDLSNLESKKQDYTAVAWPPVNMFVKWLINLEDSTSTNDLFPNTPSDPLIFLHNFFSENKNGLKNSTFII